MTREMLRVENVPPETKQCLRAAAMQRCGVANSSQLVRQLIADYLAKLDDSPIRKTLDFEGSLVRLELRLPQTVADELSRLADDVFATRNYYLKTIILAHLGNPQLNPNEIEALRISNYEMAKIGVNLNQITRAFNIIIANQGRGTVPEIGKKIAALTREIKTHTTKVLTVLNEKTIAFENKKTGQRKKRSSQNRATQTT